MTHAERTAIEQADASPRLLTWLPHADRRFIRLQAAPCPLLTTDDQGRAACSVWAVRPYNCRRFLCGRVDVTQELFEPEPSLPELGRLGCRNLSDRLGQSLRFREHYRTCQRHAQREWAESHGWTPDP